MWKISYILGIFYCPSKLYSSSILGNTIENSLVFEKGVIIKLFYLLNLESYKNSQNYLTINSHISNDLVPNKSISFSMN